MAPHTLRQPRRLSATETQGFPWLSAWLVNRPSRQVRRETGRRERFPASVPPSHPPACGRKPRKTCASRRGPPAGRRFASHGGGVPNGIRTRVTNVKGWCPRPLDDGDTRLIACRRALLRPRGEGACPAAEPRSRLLARWSAILAIRGRRWVHTGWRRDRLEAVMDQREGPLRGAMGCKPYPSDASDEERAPGAPCLALLPEDAGSAGMTCAHAPSPPGTPRCCRGGRG